MVINDGNYFFELSADSNIQLFLTFGPFQESTPEKPKRWNSEKISDFVRKLGFMDTSSEEGDKIERFRDINEVSSCLIW